MLTIATVLFVISALGGATLAILHFLEKPLPLALAALHGVVAASGLVVLAWAVFRLALAASASVSLGLFVLAALGGFLLLSYYLRGQRLPSALVVVHGGVAAAGLLCLLVTLLKK